MPTTPPRPCRHPACPELVQGGNGLCPAHQGDANARRRRYDCKRKADHALAYAAHVRGSVRWQKVRALHKAKFPLCCDPFGEHVARGLPAYNEQSHHIVSLAEIYATGQHELAHDLANLAPLCTRCHARVEQMERKGLETRSLFANHDPHAHS
jgi:5-methylcytosine-specific restriction protein A